MKIIRDGETITVSEIRELDVVSSQGFQSKVNAALPLAFTYLDVDLSQTGFIDCSGVGALIALRNSARSRNTKAKVRLLNPSIHARRMFQLTHVDKVFPISGMPRNRSTRVLKTRR